MRSTAVICELNPLHNGHKYIINEAKKVTDCLIAVMSGNFTQRSECALFDKYSRAADALDCGADLVLELPFPWSSSSASFFAAAGVSIASDVFASRLFFASECGDISLIRSAAAVADEFDDLGMGGENDGHGIAHAREKFALSRGCDPSLFRTPNNILSIEYQRASSAQGSEIELVTVPRLVGEEYMSASEIRSSLNKGDINMIRRAVPENLLGKYRDRLNRGEHSSLGKLHDAERLLFLLSYCDPSSVFDADGGVGERIINAAESSLSGIDMLDKAKTKKYTDSRLRRASLYMALGVKEEIVRSRPGYTVVLGANDVGRAYLAEIRKKTSLKLITKPADHEIPKIAAQYELLLRADRLWTCCSASPLAPNSFVKKHPVIL